MKILDATTIIGIFKELKNPSLFDKICKLNHKLVIPWQVYSELLDATTKNKCDDLIKKNKMKILRKNTQDEIKNFQKSYPYLGKGESDSMLLYEKLNNTQKTYCILDDGRARKTAECLRIKFTGLLGLLKLMKQRKILTEQEYSMTVFALKQSGFRIPRGFS